MTSEPTIIDSPSDWVADHIRLYVETNGEEGHIWRGVPTLLLTVTGRKSGALRRTALIYGRIGNDYVIVASKGGHPTNPLWYENLLANQEATLQVGAEVFQANSLTMAEDADRETAWNTMVGIWPDFANYQTKTERRIPLVRLTRIS
jgi:deazaflavin-dependent oxidoreductase (nitroreductase family)